ncbi:MAG: YdcF family protein [Alphaproteobacteria bacterium]|nr:YdcF family protein [Alphaproteobacteria bacterium]MBV9064000.1 YdcF family protein [Alphaproteobacteria bacterium]
MRRSLAYMGRIVLVAVLAYVLGFLLFATTLPHRPAAVAPADALVTLTGGDDRLDTAVRLLEQGKAKRLLITGVHPSITKPELKAVARGGARFDCCADLDFAAEDTRENAVQAANWMQLHHFASLILVTANYHMPRSLSEFHATMPKVKLTPYPVEPKGANWEHWWRNPHTVRLLQVEYTKYLASLVLDRFISAKSGRSTS